MDAKAWIESAIDWFEKVLGRAENIDWSKLDSSNWLAILATIVAVLVLCVPVRSELRQQHQAKVTKTEQERERYKVSAGFGPVVKVTGLPKIDEMHIFPLLIDNQGREPIIISKVQVHYPGDPVRIYTPGPYNALDEAVGDATEFLLPKRLGSGESLELGTMIHTAFVMRPSKVVVLDVEGRAFAVPDIEIDSVCRKAKSIIEKSRTAEVSAL